MKEWPPDKLKGCTIYVGLLLAFLFLVYVLAQALLAAP
jgi:hypothetical protein